MIILEKDVAKDNHTLVEVDFSPNDHTVTVEREAHEGIEKIGLGEVLLKYK